MQGSIAADRVLIIDDDVMSREVLTFLLEDAGFTVTSVPSGESAIECIRAAGACP